MNLAPGEDDPTFTDVTPIANPTVDPTAKLNELLAVLSLLAIVWNFFKSED